MYTLSTCKRSDTFKKRNLSIIGILTLLVLLSYSSLKVGTVSTIKSDDLIPESADNEASLVSCTALGGTLGKEYPYAIAIDSEGYMYVTGETQSSDFPTTPNAANDTYGGSIDAFVSKISPDGTQLVYSTYLGGNDADRGNDIIVDDSGCAYVVGTTSSSDFQTTSGVINSTFNDGEDIFVAKLGVNGELIYSTYLGTDGDDGGQGITIDSLGNAYITGSTDNNSYPTIGGPHLDQIGMEDVIVTKINSDATSILYSTYLGGTNRDYGVDVRVDDTGSIYISGITFSNDFDTVNAMNGTIHGGWDSFITKLSADGSSIVYSTYIGGDSTDQCRGMEIDSSGCVYLMGSTGSTDFYGTIGAYQPNSGGIWDIFLLKLKNDGSGLVYSTHFGGTSMEDARGFALDSDNCAYITGYTSSTDLPTTTNGYDDDLTGENDTFIAKINADGSTLLYSSYFDISSPETYYYGSIAVDNIGGAYITGYSEPSNIPLTPDAFDTTISEPFDAFTAVILTDMSDSDSDGLMDWYEEMIHGTNPTDSDSDDDDINDGEEIDLGTDPNDSDSDDDDINDGEEIDLGTDPNDSDSDDDGLDDGVEKTLGTDPNNNDSDGDGFTDKEEVDAETDPLDPDDFPSTGGVPGFSLWGISITAAFGILFILRNKFIIKK